MRAAVATSIAAAALLLVSATSADAATTWLCKPGAEPNPCYSSLETTVQIPGGGGSTIENPPLADKPKIDCFYVYPTVSQDEGNNADLSIDPEQISIARYQAARFSQHCRVWAPMYRQLTLTAINGDTGVPRAAVEVAYSDVAAAWQEYWKTYNKGRGVVLIGHSQGTGMLTQLVRERIDPFPTARRRLVSALLLGGDVWACIESNGANFLYLGKTGDARDLNPIPDATWGLHLGDVNLALGNLVDLVGGQSRSYAKQRAKRKRAGKPL